MVDALVNVLAARWRLTLREKDVVRAIAGGDLASKRLSTTLSMSESTVDKHLESISRKTGLAGRSELVSFLLARLAEFLRCLDDPAWRVMEAPQVAIAEDDEFLAARLAESLIGQGCKTYGLPFDNLQTLLDRVETLKPDVVICDLLLGDLDGLDIAARVQNDGLAAPSVILITGYPERFEARSAATVTDILYKPLNPELLQRTVWHAAMAARIRRTLSLTVTPKYVRATGDT